MVTWSVETVSAMGLLPCLAQLTLSWQRKDRQEGFEEANLEVPMTSIRNDLVRCMSIQALARDGCSKIRSLANENLNED